MAAGFTRPTAASLGQADNEPVGRPSSKLSVSQVQSPGLLRALALKTGNFDACCMTPPRHRARDSGAVRFADSRLTSDPDFHAALCLPLAVLLRARGGLPVTHPPWTAAGEEQSSAGEDTSTLDDQTELAVTVY